MTARFVLSRSKVHESYGSLKSICPNISYSIKTNPEVGRILEEETDAFFSIHTIEGLDWVKNHERVWFLADALNGKVLSEVFEKGIENFVIGDEANLDIFLKYLAEHDKKVSLLLRMKMEETTVHKGRYFIFGMDSRKISELIPVLRRNRKIDKLGIHFHRKTQNTGNWSLKHMIKERLDSETLEQIDILNIGGGIPVKYKNSTDSNIGYIIENIKDLRDWLQARGVEMMMEPGRILSAPAVRLETNITSVSGSNITVDCSVYNSSMDTIIVPLKLLVEGEGEGDSYTIKGSTPCSMDIFRYDVRLKNPKIGDKIVFLNAGAYNFSSDFCNLKKPETMIVD